MISIREKTPEDSEWLKELIEKEWGGNPLLIRTLSYYPHTMPALIAIDDKERVGVLSYEIRGDICEVIVLQVFNKFTGIGTLLLDALKTQAKAAGCKQLYLMTTNDNVDALRFYQKRGFVISHIHIDSAKKSRALKPSIPLTGDYGIPIRDEIDLTLDIA